MSPRIKYTVKNKINKFYVKDIKYSNINNMPKIHKNMCEYLISDF